MVEWNCTFRSRFPTTPPKSNVKDTHINPVANIQNPSPINVSGIWNIEAETLWRPFCRRQFENWCNLIQISLKFVPKGPMNNIPALPVVQIIASGTSDKPMNAYRLLTHAYRSMRHSASLSLECKMLLYIQRRYDYFVKFMNDWVYLSVWSVSCCEHHRWEGSVGFRFWRPVARFRKPP